MRLPQLTVRNALAAAMLGSALTAACARVMSPPGWDPDHTAPVLVASKPEQLAVVPDWKGDVVFRFDERLGERGITDQTAIISGDTGRVKVSRHGSEIRVRPAAGFQPGRIYHVVLLPTIQDMFGNVRKQPVEVVFSTGPAIPATVVAGLLTDRLSGKPATGILVQAVHLPDSLLYTTASDSAGFFALRHIPEGQYALRAYDDRNHDRKLQFREPQAFSSATLGPRADTVVIPDLALLGGDSTPARLMKAEARDSLQIRLTFDDYLAIANPAAGAVTSVWRLPDSSAVVVAGPMLPRQWEATRPRAAADTSAGARARGAAAAAAAAARDTAPPLPQQELVLVPTSPLTPRTHYRVTVRGITNVNGLPGGGGSATFETAAPPARDTTRRATPADSARRVPPRRALPGDSARRPAARDTTRH